MTNGTNKRYIKWVGLGFLYVWLCAFVAWMSLWNSGNTLAQVIAFVGISLVTVSCIALAFYMSALEEKVKPSAAVLLWQNKMLRIGNLKQTWLSTELKV